MAQEQQNWLTSIVIENDVLNNLEITDVLEKFASKKLHKANVWNLFVVSLVKINLIFL